ncbi:adenosine deaminase [Alkalibacterium sp.]|nr:MAG: adenosine deaminase [Alkalibacterium sp.]
MDRKTLKKLPKVELHCHLDGSVPMDVLMELAEEKGIPKDIMKNAIAPEDCEDLKDYLSCFEVILSVLQTKESLEKATYAVIREAHEENVKYLELRFGPLLHQAEGLTTEDTIKAVSRGIKKGTDDFPIAVNLLVCALRHHSEEENSQLFREVSESSAGFVAGIDVAGDEAHYPNECVASAVTEAKKNGFQMTIHSGECGCANNVLTAMHLGAKRIGHGVAVKDAPAAMQKVKANNVLLELCPTSNIQTRAVSGWDVYPLRQFLNEGVAVSISTDNRTVSNTTLTDEFMHCVNHCDVTHQEIKEMNVAAITHSFANDVTKQAVINDIEKQFELSTTY